MPICEIQLLNFHRYCVLQEKEKFRPTKHDWFGAVCIYNDTYPWLQAGDPISETLRTLQSDDCLQNMAMVSIQNLGLDNLRKEGVIISFVGYSWNSYMPTSTIRNNLFIPSHIQGT